MKILIVSRTPWNISNSFGSTFTNLFGGMQDIDIYHICCQHGAIENTPAKKTFQMTDKSVMKSIIFRKSRIGRLVNNNENGYFKDNSEVSKSAAEKRSRFAYFARDLIWKLGAWRANGELRAFLDDVKPDAVYLPIYASCYMCDVGQYITEYLGVPVVGHITDNVFANPADASFFEKLYKAGLHKKIDKLMGMCAYFEVFAENMKQEYEKRFKKKFYVIGKGVSVADIPSGVEFCADKDEIHFVYTGNLGDGRFKTLGKIGAALRKYSKNRVGILDIYSATRLTETMKRELGGFPNIRFHGFVSSDKVREIQKSADFLVHVEGFGNDAVETVGMSFSTKIIDYMMCGKPIFAVGDIRINSIKVLAEHKAAVVACDDDEIGTAVSDILDGNADIEQLLKNSKDYLINYRDILKIQNGIRGRLQKLINR